MYAMNRKSNPESDVAFGVALFNKIALIRRNTEIPSSKA